MDLLTATMRWLPCALLAVAFAAGCDDVQPGSGSGGDAADAGGGAADGCVAGALDFCVCPSLEVGVSECAPDGTWSACDCSTPVGPGGTVADAGATADAGGTADTGGAADTGGTPDTTVEPDPTCGPEGRRYRDEDWDELMYPGGTCIQCHLEDADDDKGDGPIYSAAGTVFPYFGYEEGCAGVEGATVEITDANGQVITLMSNRVGNFFTTRAIAMPYTAKVIVGDREMRMIEPVFNGDCNGCHSATGSEGAPGRVVTP